MRIFKCYWYNKDDYGPTEGVSAIIRADRETKATQLAIQNIENVYPSIDFEKYEHYKCEDITDNRILFVHMHGITG